MVNGLSGVLIVVDVFVIMAGSSRRLKPTLEPISEKRQVKVCDRRRASACSSIYRGQVGGEESSCPSSAKNRRLKCLSSPLVKLKDAVVELMVSPKGAKSPHAMGMTMGALVDFGGYEDFSSLLRSSNRKVNDSQA